VDIEKVPIPLVSDILCDILEVQMPKVRTAAPPTKFFPIYSLSRPISLDVAERWTCWNGWWNKRRVLTQLEGFFQFTLGLIGANKATPISYRFIIVFEISIQSPLIWKEYCVFCISIRIVHVLSSSGKEFPKGVRCSSYISLEWVIGVWFVEVPPWVGTPGMNGQWTV
jgi:hypothetical protein